MLVWSRDVTAFYMVCVKKPGARETPKTQIIAKKKALKREGYKMVAEVIRKECMYVVALTSL